MASTKETEQHPGLSNEEEVPPATEELYEQLQEECENFIVVGQRREELHLHSCLAVKRSDVSSKNEKDPFVYPHGYYPICPYCLYDYREGNIPDGELGVL